MGSRPDNVNISTVLVFGKLFLFFLILGILYVSFI